MGAIIDNQRVAKRGCSARSTSSSSHNTKSAGFNSGFMSHFSQNPVRSRKGKPVSMFASIDRLAKQGRSQSLRQTNSRGRQEKPRGSGFSFPIPSFATIAVVAGTLLIALTALKWENLNINMPEKYAFTPSEDENPGQKTLRYAATGISGITPSLQLPERDNRLYQQKLKQPQLKKLRLVKLKLKKLKLIRHPVKLPQFQSLQKKNGL